MMCLFASYKKKMIFFCILKINEERSRSISQRYESGDPNRIRTKMSRIPTLVNKYKGMYLYSVQRGGGDRVVWRASTGVI
jgi:hypothetical protein